MDFDKLVSKNVDERTSYAEFLRSLADDVELNKVDGIVTIVDRDSDETSPLVTRVFKWDYFATIGVLSCILGGVK